MSTFSVEAFEIAEILPHGNADALELARIGGYHSVVRKGEFRKGGLVLFIPPDAILPDELMKEVGCWDHERGRGRLKGKEGNRLGAVRLRGVLSEGICYRAPFPVYPGIDYAEQLGVKKWVPVLPERSSGEVYHIAGITSYTDLENREKPLRKGGCAYDLVDGLEVVLSEKVHGSCCVFYLDEQNGFHVSSKGRAASSVAVKEPEEGAKGNWYWTVAYKYDLKNKLMKIKEQTGADRVTLYGEVYGNGVQDLQYGLKNGDKEFRAFDLKLRHEYVDYDEYVRLLDEAMIPMVPYLYRGSCTPETVDAHRDGTTTVGGDNIREGVVIRPVVEKYDDEIGRVVVKSISPQYKLRKNATEYQ
jgi:RNA ligase (TIGR02306 family)